MRTTFTNDYGCSFITVVFEKDAFDIIEGILASYEDIDTYFYIRHDRDDDIACHYHFFVRFKHNLPLSVAQEWLNDLNTRFKLCKATINEVMDYFLQKDCINKFSQRYPLNSVRGNIDLTQFE